MYTKFIFAIVIAAATIVVGSLATTGLASAATSAGSIVPVEKMQKGNVGSFQVAWSLKSAAKKTIKAGKYVGSKTGKAIRKANKKIVPSEVRNAASKAKRGALKAGRFVVKHPYGRRCKPGKFLQPICTVKGKPAPSVRDRRNKTVVHDHRTKAVVHDHRTNQTN